MSNGSYGNSGIAEDGIGSKPIPMSAYEKIFLGWSNYEVVNPGQSASLKLGPSNYITKQAQALVVLLPDKLVETPLPVDPYSGDNFYFSGSGNNLDNAMTREFTLPAGAVELTAKVNFDIELDWDYAYLRSTVRRSRPISRPVPIQMAKTWASASPVPLLAGLT